MIKNKKLTRILTVLVSVVLLISTIGSTTVFATEEFENNDIDYYVNMEYNYLQFFDNNYTPRYSSSENERDAANYIQNELQSFGYEPIISPFSYNLKEQDYNSQNVIATKKGESSRKKIVIGAHYDSVQETHGIDDNASGVALVLTYANMISNEQFPYDIEFVFFGSEEEGMQGSKAYLNHMSKKERNKIEIMINADTLLAGTYCYVYGGNVNSDGDIKNTWGVDLAKQTADDLGLDVRLNNTSIAAIPTPTGVKHSDHASFEEMGIPYIYFEATNWELPDNPNDIEAGSTGDYETELGRVMHNSDRDNLTYIQNQWGERSYNNLKTYTTLLPNLVDNIFINDENIPINVNSIYMYLIIAIIILVLLVLSIIIIIYIRRNKNSRQQSEKYREIS